MRTSLDLDQLARPLGALAAAEREFDARYPGEPAERQPVHTVYGGAHLFRPDTPAKLGAVALAQLAQYAPTPAALADALGLTAADPVVYERVVTKLRTEPVEDFRIDFEDGYGVRGDAEEDAHAVQAADALAQGIAAGTAPPRVGIRVKPMSGPSVARAVRTLDLFVTRLVERAGAVPQRFVVTLPKPRLPEQVAALVAALDALELAVGLAPRALRVELMIEATQALLGPDGRSPLPALRDAADGRCVGAHLGPYDLTASAQITAPDQGLDHPLCDLARQHLSLAFAGTGVALCDGPTTALPIGPDPAGVHDAWRTMYRNVRHALRSGFFQGWDLHPAQLPVRYAATYTFFADGLGEATARLANFVAREAQATRVGGTFDDAATGLGLLNWFRRAMDCGAIGPAELHAAGLTEDQLARRTFR